MPNSPLDSPTPAPVVIPPGGTESYPLKPAPTPEPWLSPVRDFSNTLAEDSTLRSAVTEIYQKHNVSALIAYEIIWILIIYSFRAWRMTKVGTYYQKMWTQLWIAPVLWIGVFILIPLVTWGDPFGTVLSHLLKAILRHFFV